MNMLQGYGEMKRKKTDRISKMERAKGKTRCAMEACADISQPSSAFNDPVRMMGAYISLKVV